MAEFVKDDPPAQQRDTVGLVAGVLFAAVGLTYLIGGDDALSGNWGLLLPTLLVLLGAAGLAGSGLVRGEWARPRTTEVPPTGAQTEAPANPVVDEPADPAE